MGFETGFWSKAWTGIQILGIIWIFSSLLLGVVSGVVVKAKTGDNKLLLDNTFGKLLASDSRIDMDMEKLKQSSELDAVYVDFLKDDLIKNIITFCFMWWVVYMVVDFFRKLGISDEQKNFWVTFMVFMFAGLFLILSSVVYYGFMYKVWTYPFHGMVNLISNWQVVWEATGVLPV